MAVPKKIFFDLIDQTKKYVLPRFKDLGYDVKIWNDPEDSDDNKFNFWVSLRTK